MRAVLARLYYRFATATGFSYCKTYYCCSAVPSPIFSAESGKNVHFLIGKNPASRLFCYVTAIVFSY